MINNPPLSDRFESLLSHGWVKNPNDDRLEKTFHCGNLSRSWAFVLKVIEIANQQNHLPYISCSAHCDKVNIRTWAHDARALTIKDADLAEAIDFLKT